MEITSKTTENVDRSGKVEGGGAVITEGAIRMSDNNGGCGSEGCHCSDGHWISIILPRDPYGCVQSVTVKFDSQKEMDRFFLNKEIAL